MKTQVFKWPEAKAQAVAASVKYLLDNEVVALPTETVYGLAARLDLAAIDKIYSVKRRPSDNPLIVHVNSVQMALACCDTDLLPQSFYKLTEAFWPGPLTLVLKKSKQLSTEVTRGLDTVAIRMPAHDVIHSVINALTEPLVAPSANLSGRPSPTSAAHVIDDLEGEIPMVIDSGACQFGVESTVLDLSGSEPALLRPGSITQYELEAVLGQSIIRSSSESSAPKSPGMKYRHYAPKHTMIHLCTEAEFDLAKAASDSAMFCIAGEPTERHEMPLSQSNVYDLFRQADKDNIDHIYILNDQRLRADQALFNRVQKAAQTS